MINRYNTVELQHSNQEFLFGTTNCVNVCTFTEDKIQSTSRFTVIFSSKAINTRARAPSGKYKKKLRLSTHRRISQYLAYFSLQYSRECCVDLISKSVEIYIFVRHCDADICGSVIKDIRLQTCCNFCKLRLEEENRLIQTVRKIEPFLVTKSQETRARTHAHARA